SYDHLAGNGLAGMHWTLSGISVITRCPQTFAQDGLPVAVAYGNDRLCLDGQRLVDYSGSYWSAGTQYRTEIDTFQRVVQQGTAGGADSFYVDHGNGLRSYFGTTADSRVEVTGSSGAVKAWLISY